MSAIPTASRLLVVERDLHRCCRCKMPTAGHFHHRRSRSEIDDHTHCPCNGVYLCPTCHTWAHSHPTEAMKAGFIVSRYVQFPGSIPVVTPWGTRLHDCDGTVRYE